MDICLLGLIPTDILMKLHDAYLRTALSFVVVSSATDMCCEARPPFLKPALVHQKEL